MGRRRWTRGAVGAALAAVALVGLLWLVRDDGRGGAGADATSTTTTATTAPPTTSGSPTGGIQPDVTYDVDGIESADGDLDARLADAEAIMEPLGPQVVVADLPTREFTAFPAVARYQGFNPVAGATGCAGIMTRPLTVTGSWEKTASSGEQTAVVLVAAFDTERDAAEWAVALATEAGLQNEECTGFDLPPDRRSPESLQVSHRDVELPGLPDGTTYNTWVRPPARDVGGTVWEASALLVRGRYTIVVSVRYDVTDGSPPDALAAIAANVASRL